jgi:hypothetical protein
VFRVVAFFHEFINPGRIVCRWYMWKFADDMSFEKSTSNCSNEDDENWLSPFNPFPDI